MTPCTSLRSPFWPTTPPAAAASLCPASPCCPPRCSSSSSSSSPPHSTSSNPFSFLRLDRSPSACPRKLGTGKRNPAPDSPWPLDLYLNLSQSDEAEVTGGRSLELLFESLLGSSLLCGCFCSEKVQTPLTPSLIYTLLWCVCVSVCICVCAYTNTHMYLCISTLVRYISRLLFSCCQSETWV